MSPSPPISKVQGGGRGSWLLNVNKEGWRERVACSISKKFLTASPRSFLPYQGTFLKLFSFLGSPIQFSKEIAALQVMNWREVYTCYSRPISKRPMDLIKHKQLGNLLPTPKPTSLFYSVSQIISLILCVYSRTSHVIWLNFHIANGSSNKLNRMPPPPQFLLQASGRPSSGNATLSWECLIW